MTRDRDNAAAQPSQGGMETVVLKWTEDNAGREAMRHAAELLKKGRLVAFPTETVYGLGADALNADAVARIYAAKGRPANNPVIVHVPDEASAAKLVGDWPSAAQLLAKRFWPGSLTLILPRASQVPDIVTAGGSTVALRVPAHPVALALLREAGTPIAAPSANRSTRLSPTTASHVMRSLRGRIDAILDGGPAVGGIESTVLDLSGPSACILRPGLISKAELEEVIGPVQDASRVVREGRKPMLSPGLMARHYSPHTPTECLEEGARERVESLKRDGRKVGLLCFGEPRAMPSATTQHAVLPADAGEAASGLYAALHDLDDAGLDLIVVEMPPKTAEWAAIRDRLRRAHSPGAELP
ncbi:MAG: threonylcarbamoyl-AMP synthase [Candidatus Sumerlaeaceae bacterium]|nr:threonylcarbamoyl-AMP synthase [Candidatus Sumerlaeaceae bacterium]